MVPLPVVFASSVDADLQPAPFPSDWIIEGVPQARAARLLTSADGTAAVMAWACSASRFNWHYDIEETLYIIAGEAFVTDDKGEVRRLRPGDVAHFPAGSRSVWHVPHEVRKVAFCRHSMPRPCGMALRAWNRLIGALSGTAAASLAPQSPPAPTPGAGQVKTA